VLRAIGMSPAQTRSVVRWQALTIAGLAIVVGLPLGIILGRTLWVAIARPINVLTDVALPIAAVAAVVVVAPVVIATVPSRRAGRLRPADVLRSE